MISSTDETVNHPSTDLIDNTNHRKVLHITFQTLQFRISFTVPKLLIRNYFIDSSNVKIRTTKIDTDSVFAVFKFWAVLSLQMSLFTFFSAVCVVLQMIGTILTGEAGGLLKSLLMCEKQTSGDVCMCCDSISSCRHSLSGIQFEGVNDCTTLTGLLTGLMYGLCVLTIFGSFLCFVATILGCTAVARETSRNRVRVLKNNCIVPKMAHNVWVMYSGSL